MRNPITHKLVVRGIKVRTRTPRRYAVVTVRPEPWHHPNGDVYVPFARVELRTDNITTARRRLQKIGWGMGYFGVIIDLTTHEEVK